MSSVNWCATNEDVRITIRSFQKIWCRQILAKQQLKHKRCVNIVSREDFEGKRERNREFILRENLQSNPLHCDLVLWS